ARLPADAAGVIRSQVFPGLWLDVAALLRFDLARVLQVLQQGLASPEHEAFAARLRAAANPPKSAGKHRNAGKKGQRRGRDSNRQGLAPGRSTRPVQSAT